MATVPAPPPNPLLSASTHSSASVHLLSPKPDPKLTTPRSIPDRTSVHASSSGPPPPPPPPPCSGHATSSSSARPPDSRSEQLPPPPDPFPPLSSATSLQAPQPRDTLQSRDPLLSLSVPAAGAHPAAGAQPSPSPLQSRHPLQSLSVPAAGAQPSPPSLHFRDSPQPPPAPRTSDHPLPNALLPTPSPAATFPGHGSVHSKSYAQATRSSKGTGFVRSHASDVASFARLPRTGVSIVCGSKEGMPSFSFVSSDLPAVENLYSNALIMKFHGGRPSLEASHQEIRTWGIEHPFSIGPLSSRAFLLRFQDGKDLIRVLSRPSSIIISFPYKIFRWHNLCHQLEDSCFAPVWISLPRLPLQCFVPEFLESVANQIGRFLCCDIATSTLARPSAARLCVELDLRQPPPPFIWVGLFEGYKQPVIYERMPKFCNTCQAQGHLAPVCPKGQRETRPIQAEPRPEPNWERTQPVRQNATGQPSPITDHQDAAAATFLNSTTPPHNLCAASAIPNPVENPKGVVASNLQEPQQLAVCKQQLINAAPQPPNQSARRQSKAQKHKSVTIAPQQSNIEANKEHWEAVSRQVSILEHARLSAPRQGCMTDSVNQRPPKSSLAISQPDSGLCSPGVTEPPAAVSGHDEGTPSVCHNAELHNSANNVNLVEDQQIESIKVHPTAAAKPTNLKQLDIDQNSSLNQQQQEALERFKKKVRAQTQSLGQQLIGSNSVNPFEALIENQSDDEDNDYSAASFNSDTDEDLVEPMDMGYQSADGRSSHNHTKSSAPVMKTNKRHPNIPLNVRLRARKNSYSSSHKYLCM